MGHYQSNILAQRIENLAAQISAKTVPPTTSPTTFPTANPTASPIEAPLGMLEGANGIMIYGGAGGGLLLIILIIVIACLMTRKSNGTPAKPEEARNVVAFENPMYDDPAQAGVGVAPGANDPGLYDEPTFNQDADKENPMYQSQEIADDGAAGGYLDVQPDDDEDDED